MIQEFDFAVLDYIQEHIRCVFLDWLMPKVTMLGNGGILCIALTVLFMLLRSRRKCGFSLAAGLFLSGLVGNLMLKNIVARDRPCWINDSVDMLIRIPRDYSFPSGHTMLCFTVAVVLFCYDRKIGIPAIIAAAAVGFSRLYLYVHFPTDVFAGMLIGILLGILASFTVKKLWSTAEIEKEVVHE